MIWKWRKRSGAGKAKTSAPKLPLDVLEPGFLSAPETAYGQLRLDNPVCPLKRGGVMLTRHQDVKAALAAPELGNTPSRFSALHPSKAQRHVAADLAANTLPFMDGAAHLTLRAAVTRAFHARLRQIKPRLEGIAAQEVAQLRGQGTQPLVTGPARRFSCRTIAEFVGLNASPEVVKPLTEAFFRLFAPVRDAEDFAETNRQLAEARQVLSGALDEGSDGFLHLLAAQPGVGRQHAIDNALLVLADGVENIEAAIGQAMLLHAKDPSAKITESYIREGLRLYSPAQILPRVCRAPLTLHGETLAEGSPVFLALGSANRDGDALPDADVLDAGRGRKDVLTFGGGAHACIGERLAVLMITAFTAALVEADARIDFDALSFEPAFGHRWPRGITVEVG